MCIRDRCDLVGLSITKAFELSRWLPKFTDLYDACVTSKHFFDIIVDRRHSLPFLKRFCYVPRQAPQEQGYVPSVHEWRYASCSAVSCSMSMPIAPSLRAATRLSIAVGTGCTAIFRRARFSAMYLTHCS